MYMIYFGPSVLNELYSNSLFNLKTHAFVATMSLNSR